MQAKVYLSETWLLFRLGYCAYEILAGFSNTTLILDRFDACGV